MPQTLALLAGPGADHIYSQGTASVCAEAAGSLCMNAGIWFQVLELLEVSHIKFQAHSPAMLV